MSMLTLLREQSLLQGAWLDESLCTLFDNVSSTYGIDEIEYIEALYALAFEDLPAAEITQQAGEWIARIREDQGGAFFDINDLLQEYSLSDEDGVTLMCLAEALLRIPDTATVDALIQDKLSQIEWSRHFDKDHSLFVNASTWGLVVAGRLVDVDPSLTGFFKRLTKPVVRKAVTKAMQLLGRHFVLGQSIDEAIQHSELLVKKGYCYSYDMLGESAMTCGDADRYEQSYRQAIIAIAKGVLNESGRSLSIKLSALHPRFEEAQRSRVVPELSKRVLSLASLAKEYGVGVTIDAEEASRLELTLSVFEVVYTHPSLQGWGRFGLAVQAYSKRALPVLCWLNKLSRIHRAIIPVRLVKGAYWDSEIRHAQVMGLQDYPVFTRKSFTDTAYLACARFLLSSLCEGHLYPQFATHNAQTVACIIAMTKPSQAFEFQKLHGMGSRLYDAVKADHSCHVRIYAPVGSHQDLLPYLVRRLLENGANSSFVHQLSDNSIAIESLVKMPLDEGALEDLSSALSKPGDIFLNRKNSSGCHLDSLLPRVKLLGDIKKIDRQWSARPIVDGVRMASGEPVAVVAPFDHEFIVGECFYADATLATQAIEVASAAFSQWRSTPVDVRANMLNRLADLLEKNRSELIALCQREAGKVLPDAIDEIREAVDFCRYYAQQALERLSHPQSMPGPTGESNELILQGRGVLVCISPWNFPMAIFVGQIAASLVAGNTVLAKPAEATSVIAYRAVELFYEAGVPTNALQFLPGSGTELGAILNSHNKVAGVVFTGSVATAHAINRTLSARASSIATFIAETGGLNAMIVDSTALLEQVAKDAVTSAFSSAGQRCSALRILYVQEEIAERVIELIKGMMNELAVGDPRQLQTDIGPVIDQQAHDKLSNYIAHMQSHYFCYQASNTSPVKGTYILPTLIEVDSIAQLSEEQFGPILHVARYKAENLNQVIDDINQCGYGLTLGVHSRNQSTCQKISQGVDVGNVYINRNQVGAVVGVNPFGGCHLSGTGPKAGGPHYLLRLVTEKTITQNLVAIGGDVSLLNQHIK